MNGVLIKWNENSRLRVGVHSVLSTQHYFTGVNHEPS